MPVFDAEAHLKLDRLVAGQERFDEIEPVMRLILETLRVTGERITTLREMIEALMKAASQPADDGGLGAVLRGILG